MLKTIAAFDRIGEENAFAVLARANALAAQGRDIINLGIGQPDFRTPDFIVEAAIKALRDGKPSWELQNIAPPSDLLKQETRLADYAAWTRDFLAANPKA